ncbi:hypothetical protein [Oricola cellulosilytica]|uniref:DUF4261 domain-containing protein n=1 Tax=Oricola cellulosilytica TaxID=1429082 RepID=A0A4V6N6B8_9HYPH|nr:hypothetical protein [Oricola cellulosilytica]TCD15017.1 hypothetical protein E0D97_05570 [Oricola cellulosilytica]
MYDSEPSFDAQALISGLQALSNGDVVSLDSDGTAGPNRYLRLSTGGCSIAIEAGNDVRQRAAYFEALDWPMLHRSFEDAEEVVRAHQAHIHITVETEFDAVANALGVRAMDTSLTRNKLAANVAAALCRLDMPTAVHWKPCEMLYRPAPFLRELETNPVAIFVRVTPFSSNKEVAGVRLIGASTRGAADILGMEAVLEEAPIPVFPAMDLLQSFVSHCHGRGAYLPHLSTYSPQDGEIVLVRHLESTPEIAEAHVSLEIRQSAEAGYDSSDPNVEDIATPRTQATWDGGERRSRPRTAKPFGRRRLT